MMANFIFFKSRRYSSVRKGESRSPELVATRKYRILKNSEAFGLIF